MHHSQVISRLVAKLAVLDERGKRRNGSECLARLVGRDFTTISHWKKSGIPPLMWPKMARIAAQHGIATSVERLERTSPHREAEPRPRRTRDPLQTAVS
jgi:hypothetical protein